MPGAAWANPLLQSWCRGAGVAAAVARIAIEVVLAAAQHPEVRVFLKWLSPCGQDPMRFTHLEKGEFEVRGGACRHSFGVNLGLYSAFTVWAPG